MTYNRANRFIKFSVIYCVSYIFSALINLSSIDNAHAQLYLRIEGNYPIASETSDLFNSPSYHSALVTPELNSKFSFAASAGYEFNDIFGAGLRVANHKTSYEAKRLGGTTGDLRINHDVETIAILPELTAKLWLTDEKLYGIYGKVNFGIAYNKINHGVISLITSENSPSFPINRLDNHKSSSTNMATGLELGFEYSNFEHSSSPNIGYFIGSRADWLSTFKNGTSFDSNLTFIEESLSIYSIVTGVTIYY